MSGDDDSALIEPLGFTASPLSADLVHDLRHYLIEPEVVREQRRPLMDELDAFQRRIATSRTEKGLRRIRGPAGSGKSLVLAARASELAVNQQKRVLVAYFNTTLGSYLQDLAVRTQPPGTRTARIRSGITWLHFHEWCKRVCYQSGLRRGYKRLPWYDSSDPDEILNTMLPELAQRAVEIGGADTYDAILVDEAQDFRLDWWKALQGVLKPGGEMLLVADATQDLYGTARAWTDDAMQGAGFAGPWVTLKASYRLPPELAERAAEFGRRYLAVSEGDEFVLLPASDQRSLDVYPCALRWRDISPADPVVEVCVAEVLRMLTACEDLAIPDDVPPSVVPHPMLDLEPTAGQEAGAF